jgi:hypothetical protein
MRKKPSHETRLRAEKGNAMARRGTTILCLSLLLAGLTGGVSVEPVLAQSSSDSYRMTSGALGSVGGRSTSPGYVLTGQGGDAPGIGQSVGHKFAVKGGFIATLDRTGPSFLFLVLQNTIYSKSAAIHVFPSETLAAAPQVLLNGQALAVSPFVLPTATVYRQTADLGAGTNNLEATGTDRLGNGGSSNGVYSAALFHRRIGGEIASADGRLRLSVGEDALSEDAWVVCTAYDETAFRRLTALGAPGLPRASSREGRAVSLPGRALSPLYVFSERLEEMNGRARIDFSYENLLVESEDPADLRVYRLQGGEWTALESWLDEPGRSIVAFSEGGGAFQVRLLDAEGNGSEADGDLPTVYSIGPNFPNPFNPTTRVNFGLPERAHARLVIYDIRGAQVKTLVDRVMAPGRYSEVWNGVNDRGIRVASGVYFYRFTAGPFEKTQKMVLLK